MPLLNFQQFLNGVENSLDNMTLPDDSNQDPHQIEPQAPPKLPEDTLSTIFDVFTSSNFSNLKIAGRVNTFLYSRYQSKLYRYITLNEDNIGEFQLHATLNLASASGQGQTQTLKRGRARFTSLCQSVTHLDIVDQEGSQGLVEILSSSRSLKGSFSLFKNVEYLILRGQFMRFLQRIDYHSFDNDSDEDDRGFDSRKVVHLLARHLKPKHLCIKKLSLYNQKNFKSPEIWKIELLKKNWKLASMTFHGDVGETRIIFSDVATQRFFTNSPRSRLVPSTESPPIKCPTQIEVHSTSFSHAVIIPREFNKQIKSEHISMSQLSRSTDPSVCCKRFV